MICAPGDMVSCSELLNSSGEKKKTHKEGPPKKCDTSVPKFIFSLMSKRGIYCLKQCLFHINSFSLSSPQTAQLQRDEEQMFYISGKSSLPQFLKDSWNSYT